MDELDLLRDPDDAATAPIMPVPRDPTHPTGPLPFGQLPGPGGPLPFEGPPGPGMPGSHRHDGPARPWAWLVAVVAAALLAVAGLVWMIGAAIGGDRPAPAAAPVPSATASLSLSAPSTVPVDTSTATAPTPSAVPTVTIPPAPSATRIVPTPKPSASATPQFVRVPDVTGDRVRNATRTLEKAGFRVSVVGFGGSEQDNRRVAAQSPGPGARARYGSTIVLLVTAGR